MIVAPGTLTRLQYQVDGTWAPLAENTVATGAVGSAQLTSNAVTSASIASGAVTSAKLASNAVTSVQLADDIELTTLTAGSMAYASPQTRYLAVPAAGFRPHDFGTNSTVSYTSGVSGFAFSASGTGTARATAPVYLPHGATITGMRLIAFDNNATNDMTMVLRVANSSGTTSTGLATNTTSGAVGSAQTVDSAVLSHTVNNDGQRLFLTSSWDAASGSSLEIRQVTLTYTVTSPLP